MSWEKVKFTKVVKDVTSGNTKLNQNSYQLYGDYPIIDQGEKFIGGFYNEDVTVKLTKPVVIFGDHSKCVKYVDFNFILGADGVKVLETSEALDPKFLYYFLHSIELPNVGYSRHFKFLKETEIPLPPLPIQEKIAAILDKADELRRKDQELLKKYDELAQAIFIDMFGDPVKNEKGWEVKSGIECLKIVGGKAFKSSDYKKAGVPLIRIGTVNKGYFDHSQVVFIAKSDNFSRYIINPGDLLMTLTGTVGKDDYGNIFMIGKQYDFYYLNQRVAKIVSDFNKLFLMYYFKQKTVKKELTGVSRGVRQANISNSDFFKLNVISPPIHLQEAFAKKIELINQIKAKINAEKSHELFQSLLQRAFEGELVI